MEVQQTTSGTTHLSKYRRAKSLPPIWIGRPKQRILQTVGRFDYLNAVQITRLLYSPKSLTYVQKHLMELYQHEYLQRVFLPSRSPHGSPLAIYCLDNKGLAYLKNEGEAPEGRFNAREQATREEFFLRHTLAVNDLLILCQKLEQQQEGLELARFMSERELKRKPVYVSLQSGRLSVVPDAWVDFRYQRRQFCIAFELDRDTEDRRAFCRKIEGLLRYSGTPYTEAFGTKSLTILFVSIGRQKQRVYSEPEAQRRLKEMVSWTEQTLQGLKAEREAELFLFAAFDPAVADPVDVLFGPTWIAPFDPKQQPFFDGGQALHA